MSKNKTIASLNDFCRKRMLLGKSFAFYRLPHGAEVLGLEADASAVLKNFDPELKGFLFHPYDTKKQNIEFIAGAMQSFHFEENQHDTPLSLGESSSEKASFVTSREEYQEQFNHYQQAFSKGEIKKAILSRIKLLDCDSIDVHSTFVNLLKNSNDGLIFMGDLNDYDGEILDLNNDKPISMVLNILKGQSGTYAGQYELKSVASLVNQDQRYTDWWDKNSDCTSSLGEMTMIDHFLVTPNLVDKITNVSFPHPYPESCGTTNSDHYPIVVDFTF